MNTKIEFIANSLISENGARTLSGYARYEDIKEFYNANKIALPVSLTFTETKAAPRLTKDEQIAIQRAYIAQLKAGKIDEETESNYNAIGTEDGKVTFTDTVVFSECVSKKGYTPTAKMLVDRLTPSMQEKWQKESRKQSSLVAIDSIPELVKALTAIYEDALKERATANTATK